MATKSFPGYALKYKNHVIEFEMAFQEGFFSSILEYESNWTELMKMMGFAFELHDDLKMIEVSTKEMSVAWLLLSEENHNLEFNVKVVIKERQCYLAGRRKQVTIHFGDELRTDLRFLVTRLRKLQSLRDMAVGTITESLAFDKDEEIEHFEIPKSLKEDLRMGLISQWTTRWHKISIKKENEQLGRCPELLVNIKRKHKSSKKSCKRLKNWRNNKK